MPARRKARSEEGNPVGSMICASNPRQAVQAQDGAGVLRNVRLVKGDPHGPRMTRKSRSANELCGLWSIADPAGLALSL